MSRQNIILNWKMIQIAFFALLFIFNAKAFAENPLSDAEITGKITAEIAKYPELAKQSLTIRTDQGVVTIFGTIDTLKNAELAIEIAASIKDVKIVTAPNLNVTNATNGLADALIAGNIKGTYLREKIFGDIPLVKLPVQVTSNNGLVFLDGAVDNRDQLRNAILVAQKIPGVTRVISRLNIRPASVSM